MTGLLSLRRKRPKGSGNLFWGEEEHALRQISKKSIKKREASRIRTFEQAPLIRKAIEKKTVNSYIAKKYGDVTPETIGDIRKKVGTEIKELQDMERTFASGSDMERVRDIKESIGQLRVLLRTMEKIALSKKP